MVDVDDARLSGAQSGRKGRERLDRLFFASQGSGRPDQEEKRG